MQELSTTDWQDCLTGHDINDCFNQFHDWLSAIFERNIPLNNKKIKEQHANKPYIDEIKQLIKEKNRLQRKYQRKPLTYERAYKSIRNQVKASINRAKAT